MITSKVTSKATKKPPASGPPNPTTDQAFSEKPATEIAFSKGLRKRSEIHWARKIWHSLAVSLMAAIFAFAPYFWSVLLLATFWAASLAFDFYRLRRPAVNDLVLHIFGPLMRDSEKGSLAGTSYLLTGTLISVLVFKFDVVLLSLLFLAFADPTASLVGIRFGKDRIFGHKTLQGTLAAFFVCFLISLTFLNSWDLNFYRWIFLSLLAGMSGALSEAIPFGKWDDNLTFPILNGIFLTGLFSLFSMMSFI